MPVTEPEEIMVGAAGGAMVPLILRRYKDRPVPSARLGPFEVGDFRRPSVFGSIGLGGLATALGMLGARGRGPLAGNRPAFLTATAFGGASIMGGLGSWMYSPEEVSAAYGARRPAARGVTLKVGGATALKAKEAGRATVTATGVAKDRYEIRKPEAAAPAANGRFMVVEE